MLIRKEKERRLGNRGEKRRQNEDWAKVKALANEDTLLPMMFLGPHKVGNICCGHKMFLNKIRNIFLCPGHKICVRNKCCVVGQTGKHLCRQQCVRNNVSSFARALKISFTRGIICCCRNHY